MNKRTAVAALLAAGGMAAITTAWAATSSRVQPRVDNANQTPRVRSIAAFKTVAQVLRHPRCLNCHPSGDVPRIGDQRELHAMNVRRGPDGRGVAALQCSACHQKTNQPLVGVPGAPHWRLAPRSMAWENLDDHGLAEQLKDRTRNGDKSLADLVHHVEKDPLVLWGWDPGPERTPVPVPHAEFVEAFKTWIENGAASPPRGASSY